ARQVASRAHTTAPPEKLKKDRKNEDAAKAMLKPNTTWISLRKPPEVSPNASASPVAMTMITAWPRATGPCMDSWMDSSGPSQGIEEPAALAVPAVISMTAASSRPLRTEAARRCRRARTGTGFTEKRKAGARVGVMAVLQAWSGTGKRA